MSVGESRRPIDEGPGVARPPKKKRTSDGWEVQSNSGLRLWATQSFHRWSIATARLVAFYRAQEHEKQHRTRCVPFTEHCMPSTPFIERRQSYNGKAVVRTKYSSINADLGLELDQLHHHLQDEHIKTTRCASKSDETQIFPCFLIKSFGLELLHEGIFERLLPCTHTGLR